MNFEVKTTAPNQERCDCIIIGMYESGKLTDSAHQIDKITKGDINHLIKQGDISGKFGEILLLQQLPKVTANRVLLVGLGNQEQLTETSYRDILIILFAWLKERSYKDCMVCLTDVSL